MDAWRACLDYVNDPVPNVACVGATRLNETPYNPAGKMVSHIRRVGRWLEDPRGATPILVEISPSNACNHRCPHCMYAYTHHSREKIPLNLLEELLFDLMDMDCKAINWTGGGEPLTHKKLYASELLYNLKKVGIDQGLFTNGALLTESIMPMLLATHTWVRFSLDATTSTMHHQTHGVKEWTKIVHNIRQFVALRDEMGSKTTIGIGMVVTPDNYMELDRLVRLKERLHVDYAQYKPMVPPPPESIISNMAEKQPDERVRDALNEIMIIEETNGDIFSTPYKFVDLFAKKPYAKCHGHFFSTYIGGDGGIYLCSSLQGIPHWCYGNLKDETFRSIWLSKRRYEIIKQLNVTCLEHCVGPCRNHEINKFLWQIHHTPIPHQNFI